MVQLSHDYWKKHTFDVIKIQILKGLGVADPGDRTYLPEALGDCLEATLCWTLHPSWVPPFLLCFHIFLSALLGSTFIIKCVRSMCKIPPLRSASGELNLRQLAVHFCMLVVLQVERKLELLEELVKNADFKVRSQSV